MNFAQLPTNFGLITPGCTTIYSPDRSPCGTDQADPNIKRDTEIAYNVGVQHELLPRVRRERRLLLHPVLQPAPDQQPAADPSPTTRRSTIASPLDGQRDHDLQRQRGEAEPVANLKTSSRHGQALEQQLRVRLQRAAAAAARRCSAAWPPIGRCRPVRLHRRSEPAELLRSDAGAVFRGTRSSSSRDRCRCRGASRPAPRSRPTSTSRRRAASSDGAVWQITRTTRYPADCIGPCTPGGLVNPNQTVATFNVPLAVPGTTPVGSDQPARPDGRPVVPVQVAEREAGTIRTGRR